LTQETKEKCLQIDYTDMSQREVINLLCMLHRLTRLVSHSRPLKITVRKQTNLSSR
jgi:hypothetical protein